LSKQHQTPALFKLQPSERLNRINGLIHVLALGACISNALPIILKCAFVTVLSIHFWLLRRRIKKNQPIIKYSEASGWEISQGDDVFETVNILPSTVITIAAIFLHTTGQDSDSTSVFRAKQIKTLLIVSDSLDEDQYRRFIVKLKTTAIKQQPVGASADNA